MLALRVADQSKREQMGHFVTQRNVEHVWVVA
jgi:hypothetical protein